MAKSTGTIIIGCKLPHGLTLHDPLDPKRKRKVVIKGLKDSTSKIVGPGTFVTTEIDADFWTIWKNAYPDYQPLKNGSIFEASSTSVAVDKGKELSRQKTGFEPLDRTAHGVKPAAAADKE